jgi:ribosomal protein S18 acetylase RimI-like enzyme
MNVVYQENLEGIRPNHLEGFFVGWPNPPSPETHLRILQESDRMGLARTAPGGRVIGFVTAITDGVLAAYIPLLEVLPEYQGGGIGSELVRRLLNGLQGLYMIDAICDTAVQPFYERLGLKPAVGASLRDHRYQNGFGGGR